MYPYRNLTVENGSMILLIIDPQASHHLDFHEGGSLAVQGATADSLRIASLIRRKMDRIGEVFVTLDSHHKKHIAHSAFWKDSKGNGPDPFSQISHDMVVNKQWIPRDCSLQNWCERYTKDLEESANHFKLTIWPDHCLIGSTNHAVQDDIQLALRDWTVSNQKLKTVKHIHKGMNCLTEMYSAIKAEVQILTDQTTTTNTELLSELKKCDKLFICGQALSHCVNFTCRDIVNDWPGNRNLSDIVILIDGSSPVGTYEKHGIDFVVDMCTAGLTIGIIDKSQLETNDYVRQIVKALPAGSKVVEIINDKIRGLACEDCTDGL
eukprot:gene12216-16366_t